jgi:hypothetical protein
MHFFGQKGDELIFQIGRQMRLMLRIAGQEGWKSGGQSTA